MIFRSFFSRAPKDTYTAVCDIANGSVGVAVVHQSENESTILFTFRTPLAYEIGTRDVLPALKKALDEAGEALVQAIAEKVPRHMTPTIRVFAHAPWCATVTERVPVPLARESLISKKLLKTILARVFEDAEPEGSVLIDRHVLRIALNGYTVENPEGKRARDVEVTVARSFVQNDVYTAIHDMLQKHVPYSIEIDAFVFALITYQKTWQENQDVTIIDIGGRFSAVTVLRDGDIVDTHTIELGHRTVQDALTRMYEQPDTVATQLGLFFQNASTPSQARKIEEALLAQEAGVVRALGDGLTPLVQKRGKLPHHMLLSTGTVLAPWFERILEKIDFSQFTHTSQPFEITPIDHTLAHSTVHTHPRATVDTMLSLAVHLLPHP